MSESIEMYVFEELELEEMYEDLIEDLDAVIKEDDDLLVEDEDR